MFEIYDGDFIIVDIMLQVSVVYNEYVYYEQELIVIVYIICWFIVNWVLVFIVMLMLVVVGMWLVK